VQKWQALSLHGTAVPANVQSTEPPPELVQHGMQVAGVAPQKVAPLAQHTHPPA
jgi:hypothetical protein